MKLGERIELEFGIYFNMKIMGIICVNVDTIIIIIMRIFSGLKEDVTVKIQIPPIDEIR